MFLFSAKMARFFSNYQEQRLIKARLKYILQSIEAAAKQGYDSIRWTEYIDKVNIRKLKELGYKITKLKRGGIDIEW